jgi:signal transduction histidine kinase
MQCDKPTKSDVIAALTETAREGEPATARELATQLEVPTQTVSEVLEHLRTEDRVRRKKIDQEVCIWWQTGEQESGNRVDIALFMDLVAHELRNPLSIAKIYSQNLSGDEVAYDQVDQALNRLDEWLDVLIVAGYGPEANVNPEPIRIGKSIDEVHSAIGLPLDCLAVESELVVEMEPHHLRYLLKELFQNVVRHCGDDVAVSIESSNSTTGFYVEDDGPGIPKSERCRAFQPGYSTTSSELGLGLTVVDRIATAYDWECRITKGSSGGTRIVFEI